MTRQLLFGLFTLASITSAVAQIHHRVNESDTLYTTYDGVAWTLRDSLPVGIWSVYALNTGSHFSRILHPRILIMRGMYVAYKRHGIFTYYDANHRGQVIRTESYDGGVLEGEYRLFLNDLVQTVGTYRAGKREGLWKSYDECWSRNESRQAVSLKGYYLASETQYSMGQVVSSKTYHCEQP